MLGIPGNPLFLRFKLSQALSHPNPAEWHLFKQEYYRFGLNPARNYARQNELLKRDGGVNLVCYVAPAFHTVDAFNTRFFRSRVVDRSAYFRPRDIEKLPDMGAHRIVFHRGDNFGYLCSESQKINVAVSGQEFIGGLATQVRELPQVAPSDAFFSNLADEILEVRADLVRGLITIVSNYSPRHRAAILSRIVLGSELIWLTPA